MSCLKVPGRRHRVYDDQKFTTPTRSAEMPVLDRRRNVHRGL